MSPYTFIGRNNSTFTGCWLPLYIGCKEHTTTQTQYLFYYPYSGSTGSKFKINDMLNLFDEFVVNDPLYSTLLTRYNYLTDCTASHTYNTWTVYSLPKLTTTYLSFMNATLSPAASVTDYVTYVVEELSGSKTGTRFNTTVSRYIQSYNKGSGGYIKKDILSSKYGGIEYSSIAYTNAGIFSSLYPLISERMSKYGLGPGHYTRAEYYDSYIVQTLFKTNTRINGVYTTKYYVYSSYNYGGNRYGVASSLSFGFERIYSTYSQYHNNLGDKIYWYDTTTVTTSIPSFINL